MDDSFVAAMLTNAACTLLAEKFRETATQNRMPASTDIDRIETQVVMMWKRIGDKLRTQ